MLWQNSKSDFINEASYYYNIHLSSMNIIVSSDSRRANAWIGDNNEVFLGDSFFNLTSSQQLRVLIHEYTHVTEDQPWSKEIRHVQTTLPEPPPHIKSYIFEKFGSDYFDLNNFLSYNTLADPQCYKNELNAYMREDQLFTDFTDEERKELDYRIWYFAEMANNADKYY